jgi:hypothetical protein
LVPTLVQFIIDHHVSNNANAPEQRASAKCLELLSHIVIHSNGVLDAAILNLDPFPGMCFLDFAVVYLFSELPLFNEIGKRYNALRGSQSLHSEINRFVASSKTRSKVTLVFVF